MVLNQKRRPYVDPRVIKIKNSETATGGTVRQISELKEGIDQESAKKIIAQVKSLKLKIQVKCGLKVKR